MREDLLKIIHYYGIDEQLKYIHSEYYELDEAILQYEFGRHDSCYPDGVVSGAKSHVVEEIADVMVMLKQLQYYFNIEDYWVEEVMKKKIDRQLNRIEDEKRGWELINSSEV